jgi:UDP-hydrolysing UDP-N-acetyl-D-glucosamine 2-epimerase
MKKILAITGIRSDYDLLSSLYKLLSNDKDIQFKILVGGAHLSPSYGMSVQQIEKDGIDILLQIESLIDSNSNQSRLKTASIFLQNSIDIVAQYKPDLIIYAGDREEVIVGSLLGGYLEIPTIHFFAGDHTGDGHIDNPVRHAAAKLSTAQFVILQQHKDRLLKMGESEERVKVVGSVALDRFAGKPSMDKKQIREYFSIKHGFDNFGMVIFHPLAEEKEHCHVCFENILRVLKENKINGFVSYPNTDPGNKNIISVAERYKTDKNFVIYKNLDRDVFLSIFKKCRIMVGNSSAGIIEAASIPIPVVNVGKRQMGRTANENVIFSDSGFDAINSSIEKALSPEFMETVRNVKNIYGDGKSAQKAYDLIKHTDFRKMLYKREDALGVILDDKNGSVTSL